MKPNNISRPVMDVALRPKQRPTIVSTSRPAAVSASQSMSAALKEAPQTQEQTNDDLDPTELQSTDADSVSVPAPRSKGFTFPVGLFIATLAGMTTLAILAILVYINTN